MLFKASVPGSLMLLGEHAVLQGGHALVCAVDKRMTVSLSPRTDKKITIVSALGEFSTEISKLKIIAPFQFVLAVLKKYQKNFTVGCDIKIHSEFSHQIGFGSSAAVTVATLALISDWLDFSFDLITLQKIATQIVRKVQGLGSGADVAACVFGGMVAYRMKPRFTEKILATYPLTVIYSGKKTPTVQVVERVRKKFYAQRDVFKKICHAIDACATAGIQSVREKNWHELGTIMNMQQGLMDALGVNTPQLQAIVDSLRADPVMLGAKISGSGLGDCVVALGQTIDEKNPEQPGSPIACQIDSRGVVCEKI